MIFTSIGTPRQRRIAVTFSPRKAGLLANKTLDAGTLPAAQ
jgi:hypothetical protein